MSFELLIWLAVIIVSVVAPLLKERNRPSAPPRQQPGRRPPAQPGGREAAAGGSDELTRKMEEARRRIEQALSGTEPAAPRPAPRPAAPPAGTPQQVARRATPLPRRPDMAAASARAAAERTRLLRERSAAELQVTKLPKRQTYTGARGSVTAGSLLGRDSILRGLIWHQILSEPPHRRSFRRQQSRLRSR